MSTAAASAREPDEVAPARQEGDGHREQHGGDLDHGLRRVPAVEAPDRERRAARGLEAQRAVVELVQAAVAEDQQQARHERERAAEHEAQRAARVGGEQRRQRQRRELRHAGERDERAAAGGRGRGGDRRRGRARATSASLTLQFIA